MGYRLIILRRIHAKDSWVSLWATGKIFFSGYMLEDARSVYGSQI